MADTSSRGLPPVTADVTFKTKEGNSVRPRGRLPPRIRDALSGHDLTVVVEDGPTVQWTIDEYGRGTLPAEIREEVEARTFRIVVSDASTLSFHPVVDRRRSVEEALS
jgi:hypothetical protein